MAELVILEFALQVAYNKLLQAMDHAEHGLCMSDSALYNLKCTVNLLKTEDQQDHFVESGAWEFFRRRDPRTGFESWADRERMLRNCLVGLVEEVHVLEEDQAIGFVTSSADWNWSLVGSEDRGVADFEAMRLTMGERPN